MGDRANVYVHDGDQPGVYLYTHWSGTELPGVVRKALDRGRARWCDDQYLARVIFCEMVRDDIDSITGAGISAYLSDGGCRIMDVDTAAMTVSYRDHDKETRAAVGIGDFVETSDPRWPN